MRYRMMLSLLGTLAILACSSHRPADPIHTIQAWRAAPAPRLLSPDARVWFEEKKGEGDPLTPGGAGRWAHWDSYFHSSSTASDWEERDGAVTAIIHETNDFYELLDWKPKPYRMTWWLDQSGRISGALVQSIPGTASSRMDEFREWAKKSHPEELDYLMPGQRIDPTADRAERWKKILLEWKAGR
jgi:hypothetical protein